MVPRPAVVRVYFDADVLGLAKLVCRERTDCAYPGDPGATIRKRVRPACPITSPAVADSDWIPEVAGRGWLIVTRDRAIQDNLAEIAAVRDSSARMVNLEADRPDGSRWPRPR